MARRHFDLSTVIGHALRRHYGDTRREGLPEHWVDALWLLECREGERNNVGVAMGAWRTSRPDPSSPRAKPSS
jgi:hypothetical protein